ncbi:hypothetical protein [Flavobacterium hydrophilum]|nr:hypothetical protein [Flavobacterium hydrophilum]
MKKIYFILILGFFTKGLGQTVPSYTYLFTQTITDNINYEWYTYDEYLYNPSGGSSVNLTGPDRFYLNSPRSTYVNYNVPVDLNTTTYRFSLWGYITFGGELDDFYNVISIQDLIKGSLYKQLRGEAYAELTPNDLAISNLGTTEVCAGEMLNLVATPGGFHNYVYHWQYSLDGQITWNDVPEKVVGGHNMTNTEVSRFSVFDLLGQDHKNHYGPIYFRIGYNQDRIFSTNTIQIHYNPCAPTVTDVQYKGPNCSGEGIQKLEITFDRELDSNKDENLYQLYVRETINNPLPIKSTPMFSVNNVTYPAGSKIYSYSNLSNFTSLESGRQYEVFYQAQVKHPTVPNSYILKGVLVGSKPFTYNDPKPLTFKVRADNPKCHDGKVDITIEADGGTPPYYYDNLNGETEIVNGVTQINRIPFDVLNPNKKTVTIQQVQAKEYNIRITDDNKCIEQ